MFTKKLKDLLLCFLLSKILIHLTIFFFLSNICSYYKVILIIFLLLQVLKASSSSCSWTYSSMCRAWLSISNKSLCFVQPLCYTHPSQCRCNKLHTTLIEIAKVIVICTAQSSADSILSTMKEISSTEMELFMI